MNPKMTSRNDGMCCKATIAPNIGCAMLKEACNVRDKPSSAFHVISGAAGELSGLLESIAIFRTFLGRISRLMWSRISANHVATFFFYRFRCLVFRSSSHSRFMLQHGRTIVCSRLLERNVTLAERAIEIPRSETKKNALECAVGAWRDNQLVDYIIAALSYAVKGFFHASDGIANFLPKA